MVGKKRIEWVDIAKGIAILLMVIGHEVPSGLLYVFIFSFHMPLFFIISGYTSRKTKTWKVIIQKSKKMFKRIWLLASLMVILLGLETLILNQVSMTKMVVNDIHGIFIGANTVPNVSVMWFLFVFFWSKLLFDILQVLFPNQYNGMILGVLALFGYIVSRHIWLPQDFDLVPIAAFFMWVGSYWREINDTVDNNSMAYKGGLLGLFILWIYCIQHGLSIEMALRHFPNFILCLLEAVAGTIIISYISKAFSTKKFFNSIKLVGKHTLAVLCIHHLDLYWILWGKYMPTWEIATLSRLLVDVTILVMYVIILHYFQKMKFTNWVK